MYKTRLDDMLPGPDHPQYAEIEARLPQQLKELEKRFPQCCAQCEPKARARLQESAYGAKSDYMRWMLEKSRNRERRNWKSLVLSAAGIGYFLGLVVELVAHGLESQRYRFRPSLVGLLFVWWNPKWQAKLQGRRLVGLGSYYALQAILVVIRIGTWVELSSPVREMMHTLALISMLVLTGYAMYAVKVVVPQVDWNFEVPELVTEGQYVPAPIARPVSVPDMQPWRPPTPPVEEDAMDWTPSQDFEQPKLIRYKDPSPFYGRLPGVQSQEVKAIGLPIGQFDERKRLPMKEQSRLVMSEPKFFPESIDTGLEGIFDSVFSLGEDVPKAEAGNVQTSQLSQASESLYHSKFPLFQSAFMLIALPLWVVADHLLFPNLRLYVLACVVCVVGAGGVLGLVEAALMTSMGYYVWADHESCGMVGTAVLVLLLAQEVVMYVAQLVTAVPVEHPPPRPQTRKASVESVVSVASVDTTSSASAWKTPQMVAKVDRGGFGMNGLSLGESHSSGITPRRR